MPEKELPPKGGSQRRSRGSTAETMRSFGTLGSVGLSFVISIVMGAGLGLLIDRWIGAGHWGFFIGFFLGLAAGVVTVIRASKSIK
jgi:ATP synthase protein I